LLKVSHGSLWVLYSGHGVVGLLVLVLKSYCLHHCDRTERKRPDALDGHSGTAPVTWRQL